MLIALSAALGLISLEAARIIRQPWIRGDAMRGYAAYQDVIALACAASQLSAGVHKSIRLILIVPLRSADTHHRLGLGPPGDKEAHSTAQRSDTGGGAAGSSAENTLGNIPPLR